MTDILQRVAQRHKRNVEKAVKTRQLRKKKLEMTKAYFKDSGIMEMFDAIKDIAIANPAPMYVDGEIITIGDLLHPYAEENLNKIGLTLHGKKGCSVYWHVVDHSTDSEDNPKLSYTYYDGRHNRTRPADKPENKTKFVESFVRWTSTVITPQMLADWGIEAETPSLVKRSRKILQVAHEDIAEKKAELCPQ